MTSCDKTEYTYDAEGNRIKISEGESEIRYLYDTNQSLPKVIKRTHNGISTIYVYGKELISEKTDDDTSYYHFDYRGSTVALTDKNGKITDKYQYDVYGNSRHTEGESDTPFRYNGSAGVMTDANNLLYMKSRYYDPEILRFISADILTGDIRNTQSLNRYAYCEGNPVSFTDPFGLSREIKLQKQEQIEAAKREQVSEIVHGTLDIAGMTPVVGMAADGLNGVIYIFEGDLVGASFSAVAFIPVIGEVATPSKYGGKLVLATAESGANNVLGAAGKHVDDAAEFNKAFTRILNVSTNEAGKSSSLVSSSQGGLNSKWWHDGYVDNLTDLQAILGVKQSEKGMSTLGSMTREDAISAGKAWVGENCKPIKGNIEGYSSKDGMRAFRLQYKPKEGMWRANFQENVMVNNPYPNPGQHPATLKNVHVDILD